MANPPVSRTRLQSPPWVVGMPTETVYGLAARIDSSEGIQAIFRIKQRPFFDPLIVHVSSIEQAATLVSHWPSAAQALAKHFWPGPLTLVIKKNSQVNDLITSGLPHVAIRMPQHAKALALIEAEGVPLAAPSANRFGRTSPTTAEHVKQEFGDLVPVIDGGPCQVGIESTVLLMDDQMDEKLDDRAASLQIAILRPGAILAADIEKILTKQNIVFEWKASIDSNQAPGQMKHHYMPDVPLVLVRTKEITEDQLRKKIQQSFEMLPAEIEGVKMNRPATELRTMLEFKLSEWPEIAAREFYAKLRESAALRPDVLLFYECSYHHQDSWSGILDRLTKAASLVV